MSGFLTTHVLDTARGLHKLAVEVAGPVPFLVLANKADLEESWELDGEALNLLGREVGTVVKTSAKSGQGVEEAFTRLAIAMMSR